MLDPGLLERITARRAESDAPEEQPAKQLAEGRAERDEFAGLGRGSPTRPLQGPVPRERPRPPDLRAGPQRPLRRRRPPRPHRRCHHHQGQAFPPTNVYKSKVTITSKIEVHSPARGMLACNRDDLSKGRGQFPSAVRTRCPRPDAPRRLRRRHTGRGRGDLGADVKPPTPWWISVYRALAQAGEILWRFTGTTGAVEVGRIPYSSAEDVAADAVQGADQVIRRRLTGRARPFGSPAEG